MQGNNQNHSSYNLLDKADYVMDRQGNIKSVILDYQTFQALEEVLLDYGLGKAMQEAEADEELNLEAAKRWAGFQG
jgi:hypothetical protein